MRRAVICAAFMLLVAGSAEAQSSTRPPCNTVQVGGAGRVENQNCDPKICDVLLFDGAGDMRGGACTIYENGCTPLGNSPPPSCGSGTHLQDANAALRAGGQVYRNQYAEGSTQADASVQSTRIGLTEMNSILTSFGHGDPVIDTGPGEVVAPLQPRVDVTDTGTDGPPAPINAGPQVGDLGPAATIRPDDPLGGNLDDEMGLGSRPPTGEHTFTRSEDYIEDPPGAVRRVLNSAGEWVLERADQAVELLSGVTEIEKTPPFIAPSSGPLDLTSGENWGESILDTGAPSDATSWREWERRLALQDESFATDLAMRDSLERQLRTLESQYPPGVFGSAFRDTFACIESGCSYSETVERLGNGLGYYGPSVESFETRVSEALMTGEERLDTVLPVALPYEPGLIASENAEMNEYMRLMASPDVSEENRRIAEGIALEGSDGTRRAIEYLNDTVRHEAEMYEYDMLAAARQDYEETARPVFEAEDAERAARAAQEAAEIEARAEARFTAEEMERASVTAWEAGNRILAEAAAEAAENARQLAEQARLAWERQFADEAALSRELETYQGQSEMRTVLNPDGSLRQELIVTDPETGQETAFVRSGDGYFRTSDPLEVYRNFIYDQELERALAAQQAEAEGINRLNEMLAREEAQRARLAAGEQISSPVNFAYNSTVIAPDSDTSNFQAYLRSVGGVMSGDLFSGQTFQVVGYTDSFGPDAYNQRLSVERAQAVVDYLVAQNPSLAGRLIPVGCGERSQLATADASRRVVFYSGPFQGC